MQGMTQADLGNAFQNIQAFGAKIERGERRIDLLEFMTSANRNNGVTVSPLGAIGNDPPVDARR